jgi:hypothetical protein
MANEIEIMAVEEALARLFGAASSWRKEAVALVDAAARARLPIDRATQIPPAEGERQICQCLICGRSHWKRPAASPDGVTPDDSGGISGKDTSADMPAADVGRRRRPRKRKSQAILEFT